MKYLMMLVLAVCVQAQSFELDECAVNDDGKSLSTQKDISSISLSNEKGSVVIEHDRKKGKIENESDGLKLEGVSRKDIETIEQATNILKP
ncbi:hypothetical protein [Succinivibrio sp.]|uniref:hypothetical protein n=1 Tax=Succinivibrio sp. TaxID=2053619 RepID=UPI0038662F0D